MKVHESIADGRARATCKRRLPLWAKSVKNTKHENDHLAASQGLALSENGYGKIGRQRSSTTGARGLGALGVPVARMAVPNRDLTGLGLLHRPRAAPSPPPPSPCLAALSLGLAGLCVVTAGKQGRVALWLGLERKWL